MRFSPRYAQFWALLRKIREEAGFTQAELAEKIGRPQTFVSKAELGECRVHFLEVTDICAACKVTVGKFAARLKTAAPDAPAQARPKRRSPRKMDRAGRLKN